jgi:hypothetical protein
MGKLNETLLRIQSDGNRDINNDQKVEIGVHLKIYVTLYFTYIKVVFRHEERI